MEIHQDKLTALQMWNGMLRQNLERVLFIKPHKKSLVVPIRIAMERTQNAIKVAEQLEVTKHRMIVDAVIEKLNKTTAYLKSLPFYRFTKKAKVRAELNGIQATLLLIVNTAPPTEEPKKP